MANAEADRRFAEGVAFHRQGLLAQAAQSYALACAADPANVAARFNLAVALHGEGRHLDAEAAYKRALVLKPDLVPALNNLANLYLEHNRIAEALEILMRATKAAPDFAPPWNNLGNALLRMGRTEEARAHFEGALKRDPEFVEARINLGKCLQSLGRPREALPHLEWALARDPRDASLRFLRDAVAGARPAKPPDAFVAKLFDDMSAQFDEHLVERLGYRIPGRIADVLGPWLDARARPRCVLDLGCGTGLVADALRGRFEQMHGVDLSPRMAERARSRKLYSTVAVGDLLAFLAAQPAQCADLVSAADVFIYVGDLGAVFAEVARVLAPAGRFAFSIEGGGAGEGFGLEPTGRYVHAGGYIGALAQSSRLESICATSEILRAEIGRPVIGRLIVLARGA